MKKINNRIALLLTSSFSLISLSGCSFFSIGGGSSEGLLVSSHKVSDHNPHSLKIEDGENYPAIETPYDIYDINYSSYNITLAPHGDMNILVIPVKVKGDESVCTERARNRIYNTFFGKSENTGWESVASYYAKSSYGQLNINGTVSDWYDCGYTISEIDNLSKTYSGPNPDSYQGTWTILENAISWYKSKYTTKLASFDKDGDRLLDAVWLVYSSDYNSSGTTTEWAYCFHDYDMMEEAADGNRNYLPYNYAWASYSFISDGYGSSKNDAHTFIHETGHLLGLEDYYVASRNAKYKNYCPMGYVDMMDANIIDHNAYSKFLYGWVKPYLVTDECEIYLRPSQQTGQCVLVPTSKGSNGSAFDEYMLFEFYTMEGLNYQDSAKSYRGYYPKGFTQMGVRAYHVDARLVEITYSTTGTTKAYLTGTPTFDNYHAYLKAHSNSSGYNVYYPEYRNVQIIDATTRLNFDTELGIDGNPLTATNTVLFQNGDVFNFERYKNSFPRYYYNKQSLMNNGGTFDYNISFSGMSSSGVTLTITK
ncbi:MAG: hypothetical protein K5694_05865 [Bacilli bacterium]|nr:hypothetical protein [Bacilli bacterium]